MTPLGPPRRGRSVYCVAARGFTHGAPSCAFGHSRNDSGARPPGTMTVGGPAGEDPVSAFPPFLALCGQGQWRPQMTPPMTPPSLYTARTMNTDLSLTPPPTQNQCPPAPPSLLLRAGLTSPTHPMTPPRTTASMNATKDGPDSRAFPPALAQDVPALTPLRPRPHSASPPGFPRPHGTPGRPGGDPGGPNPSPSSTVLHLEGRIPRNDLATRFWPGVVQRPGPGPPSVRPSGSSARR